jgi:glycosyltransferase involved in cell wall biosynthesis
MDTIAIQSHEYFDLLKNRGYDSTKLDLLPKGINSKVFCYQDHACQVLEKQIGLRPGSNLIYAGRISQDKNLDFLLEVYQTLSETHPHLNLLIAGSGPYLEECKAKAKRLKRVHSLGRVPRNDLARLYSAGDLFIFPSTTDTFGMVVLEAQACGLAAIVSDQGGPQEIIVDGVTGAVAKSEDLADWVDKTAYLLRLKCQAPENFQSMKTAARNQAIKNYSWDAELQELFASDNPFVEPPAKPTIHETTIVPV